MNQQGFGIKEFIIFVAVIFISLIIIMTLMQNTVTKQSTDTNQEEVEKVTYQDLEKELKLAAERYQNDNYSGNAEDSETWILSYSMLKENQYLDEIKDIQDTDTECTGYVEFVQDGMEISYTPYLKCGSNYKTKGYDDSIIN